MWIWCRAIPNSEKIEVKTMAIPYEEHVAFAKALSKMKNAIRQHLYTHPKSSSYTKLYLRAYDAIFKLKSTMDDVVCEENPTKKDVDVFIYYVDYASGRKLPCPCTHGGTTPPRCSQCVKTEK